MKLTNEQYKTFKEYFYKGLEKIEYINTDDIKKWMKEIGNEKLSHFNCLQALKIALKSGDESWEWYKSLKLNDNHWATVGRKLLKEFK